MPLPHAMRLNCEKLNFLEGDFTGTIIETNLKLIKDAFPAKDIKPNSKTFRKSNRSGYLPFTDLDRKIVNVGRDKTSVTHDNHLGCPILPVYPDPVCIICTENCEGCSRIYKGPYSMVKNCNGNYR